MGSLSAWACEVYPRSKGTSTRGRTRSKGQPLRVGIDSHRIGQTLPVTVYRLVAKGTVEEKILSLHAEKRELAQSLLEGTGTSARLETTELLELLWEASSALQEEDTEDEVSIAPASSSASG